MEAKTIRVLLVDDDPAYAELVQRMLARVGSPKFVVMHATSLDDAASCVTDTDFDVALLDMGLPGTSGVETLAGFRSMCSQEVPVVVLTALADEATALETLESGALEYLVKDEMTPEVLARSIRYALQRHQLTEQLKSVNGMLEQKNRRLAQLCKTAQEFVENVSHEFRTPLTVIREFTSIIRDGLDGRVTPKQVEHLEKIIHRADDLALMVDDMLDVSKLEAGLLGVWRRPCSVAEMIENVRSLVKSRAEGKHIVLEVAIDPQLPSVFCDEEKIRRVIINLTMNAIKFTPEGGNICLWSNFDTGSEDVVIGVTDSGPGISRENLAIIFDRFRQLDQNVRTSTKGFGLGLNIAKELVSLNLGQIRVESEPGQGSTFSFTLPRNEPRIVFRRFLDRAQVVDERSGRYITFLAAGIDPHENPSAAPVADEFLQRSVRATDLAIQYATGKWIVAALCTHAESMRLVERLENEWAAFGRNCPQMRLPLLCIRRIDTRSLGESRDALEAIVSDRLESSCTGNRCGRTVLVVDDDREVSQWLGVRLRAAGYDVLSAHDGDEGISAALEYEPDAVVLDVLMPKKDGLTVLRELRAQPSMRDKPIVVLSASVRDQHRAIDAGASYFVPKPYEARDILTAIESSLRQEVLQ